MTNEMTDFDIVNLSFLDGDVPYVLYQLIRFARPPCRVSDFINLKNFENMAISIIRESFSRFYRQHFELISNYNIGLRNLLRPGQS